MASPLRTVHRVLGLTAGAVLCLLGLSGSALVFRPELERLARPELFRVTPGRTAAASLDQMRTVAVASAPGLNLYRIRLPQDVTMSYEFILGHGGKLTHHIYVDPYSRRILGQRVAGSDPFLWLQSLHFDLLAGGAGRRVNGCVASTLLLLSFSGVFLWSGLNAKWGARLCPKWRARPARRNWGVHVALGFWTLPFLILMGSTALYFAFHDPITRFVHAITASQPRPPLAPAEPANRTLSLDVLFTAVRAAEPDGRYTLIRLPRTAGQQLVVNYVLPGDLSDLGANVVHVDPGSGAVLRVDRVRDLSMGERIVASFVPLHFGTFGGLGTRILWAILGLLPSILAITGSAMWWRRRSQQRALRAAGRRESDVCEVIN